MIFFYANSEDPDETPHYVAPHLGLRSLTMSHYGTLGLNGLIFQVVLYISSIFMLPADPAKQST